MDIDPVWLETDFYAVLGVDRDASVSEITRAYRQLARQLHPDTNADPGAEEHFKRVSAAYRVLSDPGKRSAYDQARRLGAMSGARKRPGGGYTIRVDNRRDSDDVGVTFGTPRGRSVLDDLFRSTNRSPAGAGAGRRVRPRPGPRRVAITVPFEAAVAGTTVPVRLPSGDQVPVRIPPGVADGQTVRVPGRTGDLQVTVHVEPHRIFERAGDGRDLSVTVPVSYSEAVLGADVTVPTLDGAPVTVRVPPGTPSGQVLRVRGRGIPTEHGRGDLLVTVKVDVPRELTDHQRALIRELRDHDDADLRHRLRGRR